MVDVGGCEGGAVRGASGSSAGCTICDKCGAPRSARLLLLLLLLLLPVLTTLAAALLAVPPLVNASALLRNMLCKVVKASLVPAIRTGRSSLSKFCMCQCRICDAGYGPRTTPLGSRYSQNRCCAPAASGLVFAPTVVEEKGDQRRESAANQANAHSVSAQRMPRPIHTATHKGRDDSLRTPQRRQRIDTLSK